MSSYYFKIVSCNHCPRIVPVAVPQGGRLLGSVFSFWEDRETQKRGGATRVVGGGRLNSQAACGLGLRPEPAEPNKGETKHRGNQLASTRRQERRWEDRDRGSKGAAVPGQSQEPAPWREPTKAWGNGGGPPEFDGGADRRSRDWEGLCGARNLPSRRRSELGGCEPKLRNPATFFGRFGMVWGGDGRGKPDWRREGPGSQGVAVTVVLDPSKILAACWSNQGLSRRLTERSRPSTETEIGPNPALNLLPTMHGNLSAGADH